MEPSFEQGADFIWKNARLLERVIFEHHFYELPADRVRSVLRAYQAEDGGFTQALEADLRAPDRQPIFIEFALRTMYDWNIRDNEIAHKACDFIAAHSDLIRGIPDIYPSAMQYPHAPHWNNPASQQPSMDRLVGLVGMLNWQGISHPWLPGAVEACLSHISTSHYTDAHVIHTAFCLVESIPQSQRATGLYNHLVADLMKADFFILEAPVTTYGLTPLIFAPFPTSYCRPIFTDAQIKGHLDDLASQQQPDGGWPISWTPPSEMGRWEWRAQRTLLALATLRAYGRI